MTTRNEAAERVRRYLPFDWQQADLDAALARARRRERVQLLSFADMVSTWCHDPAVVQKARAILDTFAED